MITPAAAAARSGFWAMGGFAFYVWGAYGAGLLGLFRNRLHSGIVGSVKPLSTGLRVLSLAPACAAPKKLKKLKKLEEVAV